MCLALGVTISPCSRRLMTQTRLLAYIAAVTRTSRMVDHYVVIFCHTVGVNRYLVVDEQEGKEYDCLCRCCIEDLYGRILFDTTSHEAMQRTR